MKHAFTCQHTERASVLAGPWVCPGVREWTVSDRTKSIRNILEIGASNAPSGGAWRAPSSSTQTALVLAGRESRSAKEAAARSVRRLRSTGSLAPRGGRVSFVYLRVQ